MDIFDKIKKVSESALEKGKEAGRYTKLKFEIASLESDIKDLKKEIGEIVFKEKIQIENNDIKNIIEKIDKNLNEINKKDEELKNMKEDTKEKGEEAKNDVVI